ncbi:hypothetical protein [Tomitella biformata]|nr:hypothetical protein [Tomitella biformata]
MVSTDIMRGIGEWLADGMLRGDPFALASVAVLVPIGAILGSTVL